MTQWLKELLFIAALGVWMFCLIWLSVRPRRRQQRPRSTADNLAEINALLHEIDDRAPVPAEPPAEPTPDPRQALLDAWQRAMDPSPDDRLQLNFPGGCPEVTVLQGGIGRERGFLRVDYRPWQVKPDPRSSNPANKLPPAAPGSALAVLERCAEEIVEEERPVVFRVFTDMTTMERAPEPPEVRRTHERFLRSHLRDAAT